MYNGIGLQTPRGSGTNGHVQRNWAFVRAGKKDNITYKSEEDITKLDATLNRQPNQGILDHERKRKIEVKCAEFEEILERQGYTAEEIKTKVNLYRNKLMGQGKTIKAKDESGRIAVRETHQIAEAQQEKNAKLREAFGISEYFIEGSSFDPDRKAKEKLAKSTALQQELDAQQQKGSEKEKRKYTLVRTPSKEKEIVSTSNHKKSNGDESTEKKRKKKHKLDGKSKKKKSREHKDYEHVFPDSVSASNDDSTDSVTEKEVRKRKKSKKEKKKRVKKKKHRSESEDSDISSSEAKCKSNNRSKNRERSRSPQISGKEVRGRSRERRHKNESKSRYKDRDTKKRGESKRKFRSLSKERKEKSLIVTSKRLITPKRSRNKERSLPPRKSDINKRDEKHHSKSPTDRSLTKYHKIQGNKEESSKRSKSRSNSIKRKLDKLKSVNNESPSPKRRMKSRSRSVERRNRALEEFINNKPKSSIDHHDKSKRKKDRSRSSSTNESKKKKSNERRKRRKSRSKSTSVKREHVNPFKLKIHDDKSVEKSKPSSPTPHKVRREEKMSPDKRNRNKYSTLREHSSSQSCTDKNRKHFLKAGESRNRRCPLSHQKRRSISHKSTASDFPSRERSLFEWKCSPSPKRRYSHSSIEIQKNSVSPKRKSYESRKRTPSSDKSRTPKSPSYKKKRSPVSRKSSVSKELLWTDRKYDRSSDSPGRKLLSRKRSPSSPKKQPSSPESRRKEFLKSPLSKHDSTDSQKVLLIRRNEVSLPPKRKSSSQSPKNVASRSKSASSSSSDSSDLSYSPARRNPERYRDILELIEKEKKLKKQQKKKQQIDEQRSPSLHPPVPPIRQTSKNSTRSRSKDKKQKILVPASAGPSNNQQPVVRLHGEYDDSEGNESENEARNRNVDKFIEAVVYDNHEEQRLKELEMLKALKFDIAAKAKEKIKTIEKMASKVSSNQEMKLSSNNCLLNQFLTTTITANNSNLTTTDNNDMDKNKSIMTLVSSNTNVQMEKSPKNSSQRNPNPNLSIINYPSSLQIYENNNKSIATNITNKLESPFSSSLSSSYNVGVNNNNDTANNNIPQQKAKIIIKPFKIHSEQQQAIVSSINESTIIESIVAKVSNVSVDITEKLSTTAVTTKARNGSPMKRRSSRGDKSKSHSASRSSYSSSSSSSRSSRSRSHSSRSSKSSRSTRSRCSSSENSRSRSRSRTAPRSPSIPRRRGSPSFLDRRRITSARKRPIPYHRPTPSSVTSESSYRSRGSSPYRSLSRSRSPSNYVF